jgi:hypothetical protein
MNISKARNVFHFLLQRRRFYVIFVMFNTFMFRLTGRSSVGASNCLLLLGDLLLLTFFLLGNECGLAVKLDASETRACRGPDQYTKKY